MLMCFSLVGLFNGCVACILSSLEYHFDSLLLSLITGICSEIPCLLSCILQKTDIWILLQFNWLVAIWCRVWLWGILEQITNSLISFLFLFTCTLLLCSLSQVFFEYVLSMFNVILIGLLTFIYRIFKFNFLLYFLLLF